MSCKYNVNKNFSPILCEKQVNDDFFPTLNNTWPLRPGHESFIDILCKYNINDNFSPISYEKQVNDNFFLTTLNNIWPPKPGHINFMDMIYKNNVNNNFSSTLSSWGWVMLSL